jgi:hypothetical protein
MAFEMIKTAFNRRQLSYRPALTPDALRSVVGLAKLAQHQNFARIAIDPQRHYLLDSWAVSAYEVFGLNENCDGFRRAALKEAYRSFINSWVCLNHENWDESLSVGTNIDAVYMPDDYVRVAMAVDRELSEARHPGLEKKIEAGHVTDTSMGVFAESSECTIPVCANLAYDESEFCDHVLPPHLGGMRGQIICDSRTRWKPIRCGELNNGLHFFEDTIITDEEGADRNAKIIAKMASLAKPGSEIHALFLAMRDAAKDAGPQGLATLARLARRLKETL